MADTYTLISSVTVGAGGASSIDFTSIPATYTDLNLVISSRSNRSNYPADEIAVTFNNNTSAIYSVRNLYGLGSSGSQASASNSGQTSLLSALIGEGDYSATANTFGNVSMYVPNYAGSTNKSISGDSVTENNAFTAAAWLGAGLFASTAVISSIKLAPQNGTTFLQYSTAYLYGIKNS